MTTGFSSRILSILLTVSMLMVSACATIHSTNVGNADQMASVAIENGKSEVQSAVTAEVQAAAQPVVIEPVKVSEVVPDAAQPSRATATTVNLRERLVNIRNSPSLKSRKVAVLKSNHPLEVLAVKDAWVKIQWRKGAVARQGWLKREFVAGYETE